MGQLSSLMAIVEHEKIDLHYLPLKSRNKGLYGEGIICLSKYIETEPEHACILAEELGHYYTTTGDITDQKILGNQKQEKGACKWAQYQLIPIDKFIDCYYNGCHNRYSTADFLGVTEEFLDISLSYYREIYGIYTVIDDHVIYFDPLGVMKVFG